jgi:hypothetical protein
MGIGIQLIGLTSPHCCACPKPNSGFLEFFCVFNGLKRGDVVRFVDIDEIVDHHCLNIFPIIPHAIITCL